MRKNTLVEYAKSIDLKLEIENEYGLRKFIEAVYPNWDNRCATCYALRFEETALRCRAWLRPVYLTLFVSPYQNHELMRQIQNKWPKNTVSSICTGDFSRRQLPRGTDKAREFGLYMQNYCGLCFLRGGPLSQAQKKKSRTTRRRKTEIGFCQSDRNTPQ